MDGTPQVVRFDATTLWHLDAAEWAPSTASKVERLAASIFRPDYPQEQTSSMRSGTSDLCRYCCKSRRLQGSKKFLAKTLRSERSLIRMTSIALPWSPVNFA